MSKYAALAALGEMAKGAGGFFGQMHVEKVKNERLAEARAERAAEIESNRAWQEERDELQYARGRENATFQADEQIRVAQAKADMQGGDSDGGLKVKSTYMTDHGLVKVFEDGSEAFVSNADLGMPAGPGAPASSKQTGEQKKMALNAASSQQGLNDLRAIYFSEEYKLTSTEGFIDQYTAGSGPLNILASETGQKRKRAEGQLKEGLLRTATGAAAPVSEHGQYATMFIPVWGDAQSVVERKLQAAQEQIDFINQAANAVMSQDEANRLWRENMERTAKKFGFEVAEETTAPKLSDAATRWMDL